MILDSVLLALGGIVANKFRSFLTMLSIGIGVFTVIVLMALAAGAVASTERELQGLGSPRLITVYPGQGAYGGGYEYVPPGEAYAPAEAQAGSGGEGPDAFDLFDPTATPYTPPQPRPLAAEDVAALNDDTRTPDLASAAGLHQYYGPVTTELSTVESEEILGTNPFLASVRALDVTSGTFITAADVANRSRVAVVGQALARDLGVDLGSVVTIATVDFEVVGIVTGQEGVYGSGALSVFLPETTIQDTLIGPRQGYDVVYALAEDEDVVEAAADQVRDVVREQHELGPTDALDADVYTLTADLASFRNITLIFQVLAALIASVGLFVGGIGVMNIMLVTVTERTREIGIRKAIGAKHHHLLGQFLLEAVALTFTGGLVGMLLGTLTQYVEYNGFSPVVTPFSIVLALSFSVATGLFFGLYPANRAASLPPIQALRYE